MKSFNFFEKIHRGLRKPPRVIVQRIMDELTSALERYKSKERAQTIYKETLLSLLEQESNENLWHSLKNRLYPAQIKSVNQMSYDDLCPGDFSRVVNKAQQAKDRIVDLLGTGPIYLGRKIDWCKDYKTGIRWENKFHKDIEYTNLEMPSDVKVPWEISRMQWLIPCGQAYLVTNDETYAETVRNILLDWIEENPYAHSVNWACTMEVAIRAIVWTWFFHIFHNSIAWAVEEFRFAFLKVLYLHGDFISRNLERSDINGNHYVADAAGLVFVGLFFGKGNKPRQWHEKGWKILCEELPRQVHSDGVDYEASTAYHRLVLEIFFYPAYYRILQGYKVDEGYRLRLLSMGNFAEAYTQPDGKVPLWGDADDARLLPFGGQDINDHRYLIGMVGLCFENDELLGKFSGPISELFWVFTSDILAKLLTASKRNKITSTAFSQGGYFVMRNGVDHVFIDCGPVGLAGRGGHGHNDCLSFEAFLNSVRLISDCGAYLYTASYRERNIFRLTDCHNTPRVDEQEINRLIHPHHLWQLQNDAKPRLHTWHISEDYDVFIGSHSGYLRLQEPVMPKRKIVLDHKNHLIVVRDEFITEGNHQATIPLHFAPGVDPSIEGIGIVRLASERQFFYLYWNNTQRWSLTVEKTWVSPRYGVRFPAWRVLWRNKDTLDYPLTVIISVTPLSEEKLTYIRQFIRNII